MNKLKYFFWMLLILPFLKVEASAPMGIVITYRHIKEVTYEVKLIAYRNCKGTDITFYDSLYVRCASGGRVAMNIKRVSIKDVTPLCIKEKKRCDPPNTYGTGEGLEEHIFVDTVNFKDAYYSTVSACPVVYFEYGLCCRNSDITTGAANANFYNYALLNRQLAEGNSSAQLTLPPIFIFAINQPVFYHSGLLDSADHDSVSYSFESPLSGLGSAIGYSGAYTKDRPIQAYWPGTLKPPYANPNANPPIGIYLDPESGDLTYTPTTGNEITTVVIQATEWRRDTTGKMQKIGIARYDMVQYSKASPDNNPPITYGPYAYKTCAGERVCFNITVDDKIFTPPPPLPKPAPDTVRIAWVHSIKGATFQIIDSLALRQTGRFCWTPHDSNAGTLPYKFIVEARDNACPLRAVSRRSFWVFVNPKPHFTPRVTPLDCQKVALAYELDSSFKGGVRYSTEILNQQMEVLRDSTVLRFSGGNQNSVAKFDTISFYKGGRYYIRLTTVAAIAGCTVSFIDTLDIQEPKYDLIILKDTFHCEGDSVYLKADIFPAWGMSSVRWHTLELNDTNSFVYIKINKPVADIRLTAKDSLGCTITDFVRVYKYSSPMVSLGNDLTLCGAYQYVLKPVVTGSFPGVPLYYRWQDLSTADSFIATGNGWHHVEVSNVCGLKVDSVFIYDRNNLLKPNADRHFCEGKSITLTAQLSGLKYRWNNVNLDSTRSISVVQPGLYQCKMILTCGDTLMEQFNVIEEHKPQLNLPEWASFCRGDSVAVSAGWWDAYTTISWNDQNADSIRYFSTPGWYQFHASNVCGMFSDTIEIRQINPPTVNLGNDTLYCSAFSHVVQLPDTTHQYTWSDATTGPNHTFSTPGVYWVKAKGTCGDAEDTITISQSFVPSVNLGNDTALKAPFSLILNAGNVGATRKWSNADTSESITVNAFGTYWVQVTTPCGVATDTIVISNMLTVPNDKYEGLSVYPNPTAYKLNLVSEKANVKRIEIYDRLGKLYRYEDYARSEKRDIELNVMTYPPGIYILKIELMNGESAVVPVAVIR